MELRAAEQQNGLNDSKHMFMAVKAYQHHIQSPPLSTGRHVYIHPHRHSVGEYCVHHLSRLCGEIL